MTSVITLNDDANGYTVDQTAGGVTVQGLGGNDSLKATDNAGLYGDANVTRLDGGSGDDTLQGGLGPTTFIGGDGNDIAVVQSGGGFGTGDFVVQSYNASQTVLRPISGSPSGSQTIDRSVETVRISYTDYGLFGTHPASVDVSYGDLLSRIGPITSVAAPSPGTPAHISGTADFDKTRIPGASADYRLSQLPAWTSPIDGSRHNGDYVLVNNNSHLVYTIADTQEGVLFDDNKLLLSSDLAGVVQAGTLPVSSVAQDQTLVANQFGAELLNGGSGNDTVFLNGAAKDYTIRAVTAYTPDSPETFSPAGQKITGYELTATGNNGAFIISSNVETVHFVDGQSAAFADLPSRVAPSGSTAPTLHVAADGNGFGPLAFNGTSGDDRVLLNDDPQAFTIGRDAAGDFLLARNDQQTGYYVNGSPTYLNTPYTAVIAQSIDTVQFSNGQVVAVGDLPDIIRGNGVFTTGTAGDDILNTPLSGDQYLIGGGGNDVAHIHGNFSDYTLQTVTKAATETTPAVNGYELLAVNGSGDIYVDQSTEQVQFQNGAVVAFADLPARILTRSGAAGGTNGDDNFAQSPTGDQYFVGGAGKDTVFLNGNVYDYTVSHVTIAATADHPAIDGLELAATNGSGNLYFDRSTELLHFRNGDLISPQDVPQYVAPGTPYPVGTTGDDSLITSYTGDQFIFGDKGNDAVFLHGNVRDYTIHAANVAGTGNHPAINGYELVADNGSGNLYIDSSVESVHFQDGQYLAFQDLPRYILDTRQ